MGKWQFLTISALLFLIYKSLSKITWLDAIAVLFIIFKGMNEGEKIQRSDEE